MLHNRISIPEELIRQNKNVHLSVNTININGLIFLSSFLWFCLFLLLKKLNYFPTRYGVSAVYTPYMIIHQVNVDYNTHGKFYAGEYVLGHNDPQIKNTMKLQALDCIYLRPSTIVYGKHKLFHLTTKRIITRKHCSPATITPHIIKLINTIAKNENMNSILTDNTSFAGVDNYSNNEITKNEYENDINDNIDSNKINEILHEPSEFHTPNQNNNISSSNEVFDTKKLTINGPETHNKT